MTCFPLSSRVVRYNVILTGKRRVSVVVVVNGRRIECEGELRITDGRGLSRSDMERRELGASDNGWVVTKDTESRV